MKLRMLLLRRINLSEARSVSREVLMKKSLSEIDYIPILWRSKPIKKKNRIKVPNWADIFC